jgi:hypothetical protein
MGTKRFEDVLDCWRHGTGCVLECLSCGHWKRYGMMTWPKRVPQNLPYDVAALRFRCSACGSRRVSLYPGKEPHRWQGNR